MIRSLNDSCGEAAFGVGTTSSTWKRRSGTCASGHFVQLAEELVDLAPDFCSARQASPVFPKNRNQPETLIDRRAVIVAPGRRYGSPAEPQHPTRTCRSTGLRSAITFQYSRSSDDSIAPPGLGYCATIRFAALL